jgi:hypothetical protein
MEPKEHILLIHLLAQQNLFLKQLCDALVSKGVLTDEDIRLYGDFLLAQESEKQGAVSRVLEFYRQQAKKQGVLTGLEGLPTIPQDPEGK